LPLEGELLNVLRDSGDLKLGEELGEVLVGPVGPFGRTQAEPIPGGNRDFTVIHDQGLPGVLSLGAPTAGSDPYSERERALHVQRASEEEARAVGAPVEVTPVPWHIGH
jgi:hypothetical protein